MKRIPGRVLTYLLTVALTGVGRIYQGNIYTIEHISLHIAMHIRSQSGVQRVGLGL